MIKLGKLNARSSFLHHRRHHSIMKINYNLTEQILCYLKSMNTLRFYSKNRSSLFYVVGPESTDGLFFQPMPILFSKSKPWKVESQLQLHPSGPTSLLLVVWLHKVTELLQRSSCWAAFDNIIHIILTHTRQNLVVGNLRAIFCLQCHILHPPFDVTLSQVLGG